tara:strand:+ start:3461 stop:4438 length:978 start_codon:yes stop_codon:yes gene_type:complete
MNILLTGCAGFIGFHTVKYLLDKKKSNYNIAGLDNLNNYYDVSLKKDRLKILKNYKKFTFLKVDILNRKRLEVIFQNNKIDIVIHLAAQAGVRHSVKNPEVYFNNNISGFFNILEAVKNYKVKHLITASTSSVYGNNKTFPTNENIDSDKPLSFYAASKKCNEVMAYSYSHIYKIPITVLRFFTVYGPYGRPDMSLFKFVKNMMQNKKIELFNYGNHTRDFTDVEDIVFSIEKILNKKPLTNPPYSIVNISGSDPKSLKYFLSVIEKKMKKTAKINLKKMQIGDVRKTHADNRKLTKYTGKHNFISVNNGISNFIDWFVEYFKNK